MQNIKIVHSGLPTYWRSNNEEIIFNQGKGGKVFDTLGRGYFDFVLGYGPVIIGHNNDLFTKNLTNRINTGIHFPGYSNTHSEFINRLLSDLSCEKQVCFFKTGSEAISGALRIAALYTQKMGIIRCGFIGWHDSQVASSTCWHEALNSKLRNEIRYKEYMRGVQGDEAVYNWISLDIDDLEKIILQHKDTVGAFVIDAYQLTFMSEDTLKQALKLCKKFNILTIFDETKTGARYVKASYAFKHKLDVDMVVFGKALANGAPLSLLVGSEEFLSLSGKARITGTFSKELLAINCALATLDVMEKCNGYESLYKAGDKIVECFNNAVAKAELADHLSAKSLFKGSMFDIIFSDDIVNELSLRKNLLVCMADAGVLILQGHPSFVCLDHQHINFNELEDAFYQALSQWKTQLKN
ncbi:MAG: aminotransferase class III-fold pyridoxal phosphate-dependent enzyme [Gammaproteobacteria bacterium]|nr:aminotransferase class III-fold pyridoxal phosphate-dependent enzyme [Gammaproteobacteria bacterium]